MREALALGERQKPERTAFDMDAPRRLETSALIPAPCALRPLINQARV